MKLGRKLSASGSFAPLTPTGAMPLDPAKGFAPESLSGAFLRWGRRALALQIQKRVDRSDVISEVPECSKIQIFRGYAPDSAAEVTALPRPPN